MLGNDEYLLILITVCILLLISILIVTILNNKKTSRGFEDDEYTLNSIQQSLKELHNKNDNTSKTTIKVEDRMSNIINSLKDMSKENIFLSNQMKNVYEDVHTMNDIMVNKKTRGNWGEYQLNNLLSIYAGDSTEIYTTQYSLKNGYIGDVALHLPNDNKVLIVDSKFPVENYKNLSIEGLSDIERQKYQSLFKQNIKKHINDICKKYVSDETVEYAVMFIPSEAIYYYVCSECGELIDFAHSRHVLITSPTTLLGVVFTIVNITKDVKRAKNIKALEKDIVNMYEDSLRLQDRLDTMEKAFNKFQTTFKDVTISTDKINKRIEKIHDGYSEEEENITNK